MRPIALLWLAYCLAGLGASGLHAQQAGIHRCIDSAGNPVFTDRRCADLNATPALPARNASAATVPDGSGEDLAPRLCAADLADLRRQIAEAFAVRDPNRLAGLVLWDGYGRRDVVEQIRGYAALMREPLLDVSEGDTRRVVQTRDFDPGDAGLPRVPDGTPATDADVDTDPPALTVVTGPRDASGASVQTRFAVVRQSGCLWLRPGG